MAMNRYGRVYHSDHHYNTLRFPSADARQAFVEKFEKYHASHDHDGEPPRFENITAAEANKVKVHDADSVTIDGYASHEIHAYHDRNDDSYVHYRPPTTIAPLVIVTENQGEFIDSSTLTRHELSAIFMDMPDEDFQNLLKSVERDGFKDPIIRMIDTQVLDGWHRYRAAKELNLLRKLRFRQWNERNEGDPAAFVMARNIERRHLTPGQRGQIVVSFNERFGHGGDRTESKSPNGDLKPKTREELAKEAGVGTRTIDRAVQVEKAGHAEQVISGEKSAGEVLIEQAKTEHTNAWSAVQSAFFDTSLDKHKRFSEFKDIDPGKKLYLFYELTVEAKEMRPNTFSHDFYFEVDGERGRDLTLAEIKAEVEFIQRIAKDIQFYQQGDDCHIGWLEKVLEMEPEQQETESEDSLSLDEKEQEKELYDEFMLKRVPKWKEKYASQGYSENELIQKAAFDELIEAYYGYREANTAVVKKVIKKDNGEPTIDGISDLIEIMKSASFPYAMAVRALMRERHPELVVEPEPEQTEEDAPSLGEKTETLKLQIREYLPTWKQNNPDTMYATLFHLLDARFRIKHGIPRSRNPFFFEELDDLFPLMEANDLELADKVRELLATDASGVKSAAIESESSAEAVEDHSERSLDDRMERCRGDLLNNHWLHNYSWDGLDILPFVQEYDVGAGIIDVMQKEIAAEHPKPESEPSETSKETLETLLSEWQTTWEPKLVEVFQTNGIEYPSGIMDLYIQKDHGCLPWRMDVAQLEQLISEAKTICEHPKIPQDAWKRNRGEEIVWALNVVFGWDRKETSEAAEEGTLNHSEVQELTIQWTHGNGLTTTYFSDQRVHPNSLKPHPLSELPDALKVELLKLAERLNKPFQG